MNLIKNQFKTTILVQENQPQIRVDKFIADYLNQTTQHHFSRAQIQDWIAQKYVLVDNQTTTNKAKIKANQTIQIDAKLEIKTNHQNWVANSIEQNFEIIFEDESLLIINKPAGLVVHPGAGHYQDTLINELLSRYPNLEKIPRSGVIHRIDKDTSGLLCIAKTSLAHQELAHQINHHQMKKQYLALVNGRVISGGVIDEPIKRSKSNRLRQVVHQAGKASITEYVVKQRFQVHSLLKLNLITGRTHQIRVHLKHIGFPIVGDPIYHLRKGNFIAKGSDDDLIYALQSFKRQALHAYKLSLIHPITKEKMSFKAKIPDDLNNLIELLKKS